MIMMMMIDKEGVMVIVLNLPTTQTLSQHELVVLKGGGYPAGGQGARHIASGAYYAEQRSAAQQWPASK
jgi:hypothetical protein